MGESALTTSRSPAQWMEVEDGSVLGKPLPTKFKVPLHVLLVEEPMTVSSG